MLPSSSRASKSLYSAFNCCKNPGADSMNASAGPPLDDGGSPARASAALLYGSLLHVGGVETHLLALVRYGRGVDWHVIAPMSADFARKAASYGATTHDWKPAHALDLRGAVRVAGLLRECGA